MCGCVCGRTVVSLVVVHVEHVRRTASVHLIFWCDIHVVFVHATIHTSDRMGRVMFCA